MSDDLKEQFSMHRRELNFKAAEELSRFIDTVAALRDPVDGCPWDLEQTHESLRRYMLEEAYEAAEAMLGNDPLHLREELGDVLLQVVLNSQLLAEANHGDLSDVIAGINEKMLRRHPHVFNKQKVSVAEVRKSWEEIKSHEKKSKELMEGASTSAFRSESKELFKKARKVNPALTQAYHIGKIAHGIEFDWDKASEILHQVKLEIAELETEMKAANSDKISEELGDVFFSLAQLSRKLGFEPEEIAHRGNLKFLKRFDAMEVLARQTGLDVKSCGREKLESLWLAAKRDEKV